jgi:NAD(P)-dependent dehydrogenase (short-subunit alcohol dehydrogenase family)
MGYFTGKTVIITGAGRAVLSDGRCGSIGYGIATAYAKEGANIVITGRNVKKLEDAKEELERLYGVKVLPIQADISAGADNEAVAADVVAKTVAEFGLPLGTLIVSVVREGIEIIPDGNTILRGGDELEILMRERDLDDVESILEERCRVIADPQEE